MTTMKLNTAPCPPRVNWMTRRLTGRFSFNRRQASEPWRRVKAGMHAWRRGRGRSS
jgi:hypothetical protein